MFENLQAEDLRNIAQKHRSGDFLKRNIAAHKGRGICATQFRSEFNGRLSAAHNSMVKAFRKAGLYDSLLLVTLTATAEDYAVAELAKEHLSPEEYRLLTASILSVIDPEKLQEEWKPMETPQEIVQVPEPTGPATPTPQTPAVPSAPAVKPAKARAGGKRALYQKLLATVAASTEVVPVAEAGVFKINRENAGFYLRDATDEHGPFGSVPEALAHAFANRLKLAS